LELTFNLFGGESSSDLEKVNEIAVRKRERFEHVEFAGPMIDVFIDVSEIGCEG
jgi:hypothetical protein